MGPYLEILTGPQAGRIVPLDGQRVGIGRQRDNAVVLRGDSVSRVHCELAPDAGRWMLRDLSSNGTFVNGERVQSVALCDGQVIRIGDHQLRFCEAAPPPTFVSPSPGPTLDSSSALLLNTPFKADEFSLLCQFMSAVLVAPDSIGMIHQALQTIAAQTRADVAGFLALDDTGELCPRLVLPETARESYRLSGGLTDRAKTSRKTIWLQRERELPETESLAEYEDAICLPVPGTDELLGVLHAYQRGRVFRGVDVQFCEVVAAHLAASLARQRLRRQLEAENELLRMHAPPAGNELVGSSVLMARLREQIAVFARSSAPVLIRGESGVGKELVANALHRQSRRRGGPLVAVNCGGIPPDLKENLLFGSAAGAFTGAVNRPGLICQADGGTLFLDEIAELSLTSQAALLRVLDGKPFLPLGGQREVQPDVRFVSATNRNLHEEIEQNRFREDLYYRLQKVEIWVPPLRDRLEDIPALVQHYLHHWEKGNGRRVSVTPAAIQRLQDERWPGNVRQLWNVLESSLLQLRGNRLDADDLRIADPPRRAGDRLPTLIIAELERRALIEALAETDGNVTEAAKLVGYPRSTFYQQCKALRVSLGRKKTE